MSLRLSAISLFLRLRHKPRLARAREPKMVRDGFERVARRWFHAPRGSNIIEDRLDAPNGPIQVDWISRKRPDRRAVVIYYHGGAYLMGSRRTHRHVGAWLAGYARARVLMPEYRVAPENPFPAATDDALACYRAVLDAGYEADRIALAGDSAGGGLAFATLIRAREEGLPDPACVIGFSPWLDLTATQNSLKRNARRDPLLPANRFREVVEFYLDGADPTHPHASPLHADIPNPPPALIQASRIEILADEADAMAEKWREAGGDMRIEWLRNAPHAWHVFAGIAPEATTSLRRAGHFIRDKLKAEEVAGAA
ncbi:MAG: alpha/beta hydrolase [Pseudomonadota bacterium]